MSIYRVDVRQAIAEWGFYEPLISKVIRRCRAGVSADDVMSCLQIGSMQLWRDGARKGIAVTEIQKLPQYDLLLIFMVAGRDPREWLAEGQHQLDSFARAVGCKFIEFIGRPGWEKLCHEHGYTEKFIRMRKEVG
jgi:hypothetical protein